MLDETDKKILFALTLDASRNIDKLSKYLGIPRSTVHNRIKKLEKKEIIKGYTAIINYEKLDMGLIGIIHIALTDKAQISEVIKKLSENPRVEAIYTVTGRTDIIVKARFKDAKEIGGFNYDSKSGSLRSVFGISRTETAVVLHTIKEYWHTDKTEIKWYFRKIKN